jgi:hypothetical protein
MSGTEVDPRVAKLKAERDRVRAQIAEERHQARELRALNQALRQRLRELSGASIGASGEIGNVPGLGRDC